MENELDPKKVIYVIKFGLLFIMGIIILSMWGCPQYNVYSERKQGEAILAHAQASREVKVAEAKAVMESSVYLAQADTTRARGIARANQIIGTSLKSNKEYLNWLFINNLTENQNDVIYIPTEAGIPIMEANRFNKVNRKDSSQ